MANNLLSNMTEVKHPYNYIFAGKTCFNIKDGNTSIDYEVSICNDDYNLYFVRALNSGTNKYDYAGCFRISDNGEIKYFKGAKGKFDYKDDEIRLLFDCINGTNNNLEVNRNKINCCSCCGKEIQVPNLMSVGVCSNCIAEYQNHNLKINPSWSFPSGLLISDISQIIYPNNLNYDNVSTKTSTKVSAPQKANTSKGYSNKDLEILSAAEDNINKTWGVYLDDNGKATQHVYVRTWQDNNIITDVSKEPKPKVDKDGFMDIPIGSTDAEILEKIFGSC